MNPQVVCSVAGLCNNERVQQLLAASPELDSQVTTPKTPNTCEGCHTVVGLMERKFDGMSRDEVLQSLLRVSEYLFILTGVCETFFHLSN